MAGRVVLEEIPGTPVKFLPSGILLCEEHNANWCAHIAEVITNRQDSAVIISRLPDIHFIQVPVLPTEHIYARLWVDVLKREKFLAKVYIQSPDGAHPEKVCTGDDQFIAFFSEGEGMQALRACIWEFMEPILLSPVTCESLNHNWEISVKARELHESGRRGQMMNSWAWKWYKKCHICYTAEGAGLSFDDDLIPDTGLRRGFPRYDPKDGWSVDIPPGRPRFKK